MDESASGRLKKMGHQPKKKELPEDEKNTAGDAAVERTQALHVKEKLRLARKPTQIDIQIDEDIESITCPKCETKLEPGAIICIDCSYNVQTGKDITTKVKRKSRNPYSAPKANDNSQDEHPYDLGGCSRGKYWIIVILIPIIIAISVFILILAMGPNAEKLVENSGIIAFLVISFLSYCIFIIYTTVRRLHNLGSSGWCYWLTYVPIMNIWLNYRLMCCPHGYALHGKLDRTGKVLASIFLSLIIIGFLSGLLDHKDL